MCGPKVPVGAAFERHTSFRQPRLTQIMMTNFLPSLILLTALACVCTCFRFEPESGGMGGDFFGQSELANHVPRLGRRSGFDANRFRFRINQFRPTSAIDRLPGFRFTSEDDLEGGRRNFFLIKRNNDNFRFNDNNKDNFIDVAAHSPQLAKLLEVEEAKLAEQQKEWLMLQMLEKKRLDKLLATKAGKENNAI